MQVAPMQAALTAAYVFHTLFAGLWVGAVVLTAWKVIPLAKAGDVSSELLGGVVSGVSTITRVGALVFLATGGHMAATVYGAEGLFTPPRGHVVLTMLALWVVMTGLVEVAGSKVRSALEQNKVRTAGRDAGTFYTAAAVIGFVLLVLGGYLVGPST
ncbi:CopD family protein [Halobaculum sp. CBA1158]|uniref:CopD family protein n=1 Tax=Halobaculum sp. CBA1158 TaxID=2904243 RepID=UPI001F19211D|nr:CopD family protein [Halobaculum sp. CBA1158]UIO99134.1 CopD family protein [Halobaculum sp. CBA1158]